MSSECVRILLSLTGRSSSDGSDKRAGKSGLHVTWGCIERCLPFTRNTAVRRRKSNAIGGTVTLHLPVRA